MERLDRRDGRLLLVCLAVAAVSLWVGVRYYGQAFPEATIDFRLTREQSQEAASQFAHRLDLPIDGLRHASVFDYDDEAKTFLERETGVSETNRLLETTVRMWRWRHRWFQPLKKEEVLVDLTTRGEPVGFEHLLPEEAPGASLSAGDARALAEKFLSTVMTRPLDTLVFLEGSREERPHRVDHLFTWKLQGSEVKGGDYRVEVGVAGDRVSSYSEALHVPEEWSRGYQQLRSRNEVAGALDLVLLALTAAGMIVMIVLRLRRGDVRWKTALVLGAITFTLIFVSELDQLPAAIFAYDTTASFGGFLLQQLFNAFAAGAGLGAVILLIAAAAEPLYRDALPRAQSLTGLLSARALRTKEFFVATAVGLTATCFFFAYENVFYIIANHFGAWSPRDVPYSDLLSSAVPWVYVLFFGWFPAISEEFISRMFSIPFFERLLRSRIVAVLLASAIWGFGHAAYPNQPWWIRGLEVGLAGVVFSVLFLRFGIVSVVVCHFSVDALYTAFVLIRSDSLYYRVSGAASAGVWGLVFLGMLAAYLRRGGFAAAPRTNAAETAQDEAESAREEAERRQVLAQAGLAGPVGAAVGGEVAAARAEFFPGLAPEARPRAALAPFTPPRIALALAGAILLIALALAPLPRFGDWADFAITRDAAAQSAGTFLRSAGLDPGPLQTATVTYDRTDATDAAYILQTAGMNGTLALYRDLTPTPLWRVRFFQPGQKNEFHVSVVPADGQVVGFDRALPEEAPGASLEDPEARRIAEEFARAHGQDPAAGSLKEQTRRDEKARRDHTLVWEYPIAGAGEAAVRYTIVVQGDRVGSWTRGVKIPEQWQRERDRKTIFTELLRWSKFPFFLLLTGTGVFAFVGAIRRGAIPWRFALIVGGLACIPAAISVPFGLQAVWAGTYQTAMPASLFSVMLLVFGGVVLLVGLAGAFYPGAVAAFSWRRGKATAGAAAPESGSAAIGGGIGSGSGPGLSFSARDTLIAVVVACGACLGLPVAARLAAAIVPGGMLLRGVPLPSALDSSFPALTALCNAALAAIFIPALAGVIGGLLRDFLPEAWQRAGLFLLFLLALLPPAARTAPERLSQALFLSVLLLGAVLIARFILRTDPIAWVWGAGLGLGAANVAGLAGQSAPFYRTHAAFAGAALVVSGAWLLVRASRGGGPEAA